jgi:Cdc6-like AAA superfamily ATPase
MHTKTPLPAIFNRTQTTQRWQEILGNHPGLLVIQGPSGIGKTDLVYETWSPLTKEPSDRAALPTILHIRCDAYQSYHNVWHHLWEQLHDHFSAHGIGTWEEQAHLWRETEDDVTPALLSTFVAWLAERQPDLRIFFDSFESYLQKPDDPFVSLAPWLPATETVVAWLNELACTYQVVVASRYGWPELATEQVIALAPWNNEELMMQIEDDCSYLCDHLPKDVQLTVADRLDGLPTMLYPLDFFLDYYREQSSAVLEELCAQPSNSYTLSLIMPHIWKQLSPKAKQLLQVACFQTSSMDLDEYIAFDKQAADQLFDIWLLNSVYKIYDIETGELTEMAYQVPKLVKQWVQKHHGLEASSPICHAWAESRFDAWKQCTSYYDVQLRSLATYMIATRCSVNLWAVIRQYIGQQIDDWCYAEALAWLQASYLVPLPNEHLGIIKLYEGFLLRLHERWQEAKVSLHEAEALPLSAPQRRDVLKELYIVYNREHHHAQTDHYAQLYAESFEERSETNSKDYTQALFTWANSLKRSNNLEQQGRVLQKILAADEESYGRYHPEHILGLRQWVIYLFDKELLSEARTLIVETLQLLEEQARTDENGYLLFRLELAHLHEMEEHFQESEALMCELHDEILACYGEDDLSYLNYMMSWARVLECLDHDQQAETMLEKVIATIERLDATNDPTYITSLYNLAYLKHKRHDPDARNLIKRVIDLENGVYGPEHPETLKSLKFLASMDFDDGKIEEAEQHYHQYYLLFCKHLGEQHSESRKIMIPWISALVKLKRYEQAQDLVSKLIFQTKGVLGEKNPKYISTLESQIEVFAAQKNWASAMEVLEQALELGEQIYDREHEDLVFYRELLADFRQSLVKSPPRNTDLG